MVCSVRGSQLAHLGEVGTHSILREQGRKANWGAVPFPFWRLVRDCLQEGANAEFIKEGRKALIAHQDSLSESDSKGENLDRPKRKIEKKKEKFKNVEKSRAVVAHTFNPSTLEAEAGGYL